MVYWKKGMKGPRPMNCWRGVHVRKKQVASGQAVSALSQLQMAAMEWEVLNTDVERAKKWKEMTAKDIGKWGEDVALRYLLQKGFHLVARNWFCGHKELDLIMEDRRGIHIVEVRTRKENSLKEPLESVDTVKQRKVLAAADSFIRAMKVQKEVFFDIVAVLSETDEKGLTHVKSVELTENAFLPIGLKTI